MLLILIVGTYETSSKYARELRKLGFNAQEYGVLEIKSTVSQEKLKQIENIHFDMLIFTSKNAVRLLLKSTPTPLKHKIAACKLYAVGEETKNELKQYGLNNIRTPIKESSKGLLEEVQKELKNKVVGIFHSSKVNEELIGGLRKLGALVYSFPLYDIVINNKEVYSLLKAINYNPSTTVIFLARIAFQALMEIDAGITKTLKNRLVIALGESISKTLNYYSIPHYTSQKPHINSIVTLLRRISS